MKQSITTPVNSDSCKNIESRLTEHTSIPDKNCDSSRENGCDGFDDIEFDNNNKILDSLQ